MRQLTVCDHVQFHKLKASPPEPYRPPVLQDPHGPVPFIILAHPRTGSNLFRQLLVGHPHVRSECEVLNVRAVMAQAPLHWSVAKRDANRYAYIDRVFTANRTHAGVASHASGFKTFTYHITRNEFVGFAFSPTIRKLMLRRANHVDMYLSLKKANAAGGFIHRNTTDIRLALKADHLVKFIGDLEVQDKCVDAARSYSTKLFDGDDWHSVDYDSLANKATLPAILQGACVYRRYMIYIR
jgi:hypothetical protein